MNGKAQMWQRFWLLVLLMLSAPVGADDSKTGSILVVGDSLSAAYRMAEQDGWVALLERRIGEMMLPWTVTNASVSGETTAGGLARLPALLDSHRPDIVILQLGGNDGLRGLPVPSIRQNLSRMIELSEAAGASVLLAGIQIPPNYGPRYTAPFAAQFGEIAAEMHLEWIPFLLEEVAENRQLMQADGIHPTAAAQPRILDNVWPVLIEML